MTTATASAPKTTDYSAKIKKGPSQAAPRIVLIGVEGVGKTTAGAQCPEPIFLCAEDGLVGSGYDNIANYSPANWEDVLGFLSYIAAGNHTYKSLIIDTIDWLEMLLFEYICKRDSKYHTKDRVASAEMIENYGYGKGYIVAAAEFRRALVLLDKIRCGNILVMINSHSQIKLVDNLEGENYSRCEPKVCKQIAGLIKEWADTVLFAKFEISASKEKGSARAKGLGGQTRIVQTQYSAAYDAKNRYGLPVVMPFDMDEILEAIKRGNPDEPENIIADINALLPNLPEDKQTAIKAFVKANKTNTIKLCQMLNKVRALTNE